MNYSFLVETKDRGGYLHAIKISFELENDELAIKIGSAVQAHLLFGIKEGVEKTILSVTGISDFRNENTGEELYFMHEDF